MQRNIIKVFLASPGDLVSERKAAKQIVDEENANHATVAGYHFELVGWEDTVAQHGRAQAIINRELDQCSYFVGMLWKRWGSRPGPDNDYTSGFEEEYERSQARFSESGSPYISILFKDISDDDKRDAGPQLTKVLEFRKKFTDEFRGAYQTFDNLRSFEQSFRSILAHALTTQRLEDEREENDEQSKSRSENGTEFARTVPSGDTFFSVEALGFLNDLISRPPDPENYEYKAEEAARFRLIGSTLRRSGNDEDTIGAHDANLIFRELLHSELGAEERRGLLAAGLQGFEAENLPLWKWAVSQDANNIVDELALRTIVGTEKQRSNAFRVLTIIGENLREYTSAIDREQLRDWWLEEGNDESVIVSALRFLGELGDNDDLEHIEKLMEATEATVAKTALSAKATYLARININEALEFLIEREDADVPNAVVEAVRAKLSALETPILKRSIGIRSAKLQLVVANELLSRRALGGSDVDLLADSADAEIRLIAAYAKHRGSQDFSLKDARSLIVKPMSTNALLAAATGNRDWAGEDAFDRYKHTCFCEKSLEELVEIRKSESVYNHDASFAIFDKYFRTEKPDVCDAIRDDFVDFLGEKMARHPDAASLPDDELQKYLRKNMIQEGFEILCRRGSKENLSLAREKLDNSDLNYDDAVLLFFEKFGDFSDVERIIRISWKPKHLGFSLLSMSENRVSYDRVAKALLKLAARRTGDLLALEMPVGLWNAVIRRLSSNEFSSFENDRLCLWLSDEVESKRKAVALKIVICLPKSRISKILEVYGQGQDRYFYNVVLWLDMGTSLAKRTSVSAAKNLLRAL